MDEFEQELRQAFVRRPAPPSLKRKLMARRAEKRQTRHRHTHIQLWQRSWSRCLAAPPSGSAATVRSAVRAKPPANRC
jgi:hypothetical protein